MLAFNYAAAIFVITSVTYILMSFVWGRGVLESLSTALYLGCAMGVITLLAAVFFLHKKNIKVYELKDDDKR